jgi:D-alanyl-lipoteichoic acid acyltransferase DltB (MBOAT superfamily)
MTLAGIAILSGVALVYGWLLPVRWRGRVLLVLSVVGVYWLQPALAIRTLDFALPTSTLAIAVAGWWLTRQQDPDARATLLTLAAVAATVLTIVGIDTLASATLSTTLIRSSAPPNVLDAVFFLAAIGAVLFALGAVITERGPIVPLAILLTVVVFVVLKWEPLTVVLAAALRAQQGQQISLAAVGDVGWLGFSYVAFRLIHTLRERQMDKLPDLSLREYLTYLIFFPAITAGPIDRAERFVKDLRALDAWKLDSVRLMDGGTRIVVGVFKKFVVGYLCSFFALNATNAEQIRTAGGLWLFVYGYALLLFFDFSGYTDVAIGIGRLYGAALPENFNAPYLKPSLTAFWQSWHMTLSTWARFYVFNPLSRALMVLPHKPPTDLIVLIAQVATMLVIGLWHGITWNYVMWGVWHGVGLWIHKLYTDRTRLFYQGLKARPRLARALNWGGIALTFHFVVLGWVWFALPSVDLSLSVLARMFGLR